MELRSRIPLRSGGQAFVRASLKRIRRPTVMHAQEPRGGFADWVARIDVVPRLRELAQWVKCLRRGRIVMRIVAFEVRNR